MANTFTMRADCDGIALTLNFRWTTVRYPRPGFVVDILDDHGETICIGRIARYGSIFGRGSNHEWDGQQPWEAHTSPCDPRLPPGELELVGKLNMAGPEIPSDVMTRTGRFAERLRLVYTA